MFHSNIIAILLVIRAIEYVQAQPANTGPYDDDSYALHFNTAVAGIVIVFTSGFFFLCFFAIYLRRCGGAGANSQIHTNSGSNPRRAQVGLDKAILETFPKMEYAEVKNHKDSKGALECAICLSEFSDDDTLRLLPGCSHVFHVDCIDVWLETKVTCPVCRANLADPLIGSTNDQDAPDAEENRGEDVEMGAGSSAAIGEYRRWHSTGHVLAPERMERYTLRLPEEVRMEMLRRARTVRDERRGFWRGGSVGRWGFLLPTLSGRRTVAVPTATERTGSKRVFPASGGGEDSGRGGGSGSMKFGSTNKGEEGVSRTAGDEAV